MNNPKIRCNDASGTRACVLFRNPPCEKIYIGQLNDTIETISSMYHISKRILYLLNPSMQKIYIPQGLHVCVQGDQSTKIQIYIVIAIASLSVFVASIASWIIISYG